MRAPHPPQVPHGHLTTDPGQSGPAQPGPSRCTCTSALTVPWCCSCHHHVHTSRLGTIRCKSQSSGEAERVQQPCLASDLVALPPLASGGSRLAGG